VDRFFAGLRDLKEAKDAKRAQEARRAEDARIADQLGAGDCPAALRTALDAKDIERADLVARICGPGAVGRP
jgi:hypothetical protein